MIEIIILSTVALVNMIGLFVFRKLIKDDPECVSKCCNVEVAENK